MTRIHLAGLAIAALIAAGRGLGIMTMWVSRQRAYAARAVALPRSWRDLCTVPEPPLLVLVASLLMLDAWHAASQRPSAADLACALGGASLGVASLGLCLWAVASFPAVSTGHYVLPEQRLVEHGAYHWVRNPLYLGAFGIWLGLALSFRSGVTLALTAAYVMPSYWIYIRSEETMLLAHFGDAYRRYCERVGRLLPRPIGAAGPRGEISPPR